MKELVELFGNQVFPVLISIYLLTRFESKLESLRVAIEKLNMSIESKDK